MAAVAPPHAFNAQTLDLHVVQPGETFGRIYDARYPDPLGFGKTRSRFSDPRTGRKAESRYGVLYVGSSLKVCFLEAVLRDRRDGIGADLDMAESELRSRNYASIRAEQPLTLIDLTGDNLIRMGIPTDVARDSRQGLARKWSLAFHEHPRSVDGIYYPSRLNGGLNIAVFERSVAKLGEISALPLISTPGLAACLDDFKVALF